MPIKKLLKLGIALAAVFALGLLVYGGLRLHYMVKRPEKAKMTHRTPEGIVYEKLIWSKPRAIIWHIVRIPLDKGLELVTTPKDPASHLDTSGKTVLEFANEFDTLLATNGSYFSPFSSNNHFDYYPKPGDPVDIRGRVKGGGVLYSDDYPRYPVLAYDGNRVAFYDGHEPILKTEILHLPGGIRLIGDGKVVERFRPDKTEPRTAAGVSDGGKTLWIVVVDGRQGDYSEGVTLYELANFMGRFGMDEAISLDGGGSSTLVMKMGQENGADQQVMNAPYHTRFPLRLRPVANHLGIRKKE